MKTSNSAIQTFKACRRLYELKYIYGLEPVQVAESLSTGLSYHDGVQNILDQWIDSKNAIPFDCEDPKIKAMVFAFNCFIVPKLCELGIKPIETEKWFNYETESGHVIIGRIDGLLSDGIIEHKTTSAPVDGSYFQRLEFDEQIPTYMAAFNCDKVFYTVCQKPTIRQKKNESEDEFFQRCVDWYKEDTESKISVVEIKRTDEDLKRFLDEQNAIVTEMENCKLFYRNPSHCQKWGRMCEYASICLNYDPNQEYIEFKKRGEGNEKT